MGGGFDPGRVQRFQRHSGRFLRLRRRIRGGGRGRQQRSRAQRGEDVRYDLEITLEDAFRGMSAEIQVPRMEACSNCSGSGAEPQDGLTVCPMCRGRGEVIYQQSFLSIRRTCSQCNGRGQIIRRPCHTCRGEAYQRVDRKLKINIPPGVDNGTRLRLSNEGQPGHLGGPPGDLYVVLAIKEHPIFDRDGHNLLCTVPINVAQAALGTQVDILTFEGLQQVKIPEGMQSGTQVRVRGQGMPVLNSSGRGDLVVNSRGPHPVEVDARAAQAPRAIARHPAGRKRASGKRPVRQSQRLFHVSPQDSNPAPLTWDSAGPAGSAGPMAAAAVARLAAIGGAPVKRTEPSGDSSTHNP